MISQLEQTFTEDTAETSIEMSGISAHEEKVLVEQSITLDDGSDINIRIGATNYSLSGATYNTVGTRTIFGIYVENQNPRRTAFIQTIASPLRFKASNTQESQFTNERTALERVRERFMRFGKTPLRRLGLIAPLPLANFSDTELYETAAPGLNLSDALYSIHNAQEEGRMSREEAAFLATTIHNSARAALDDFHTLGLIHGHARVGNFNVDPATAEVHLFDYTLAMQYGDNPATARPGWGGMNDAKPAEDIARFEDQWSDALRYTQLPTEYGSVSELKRQAVIAKLERAVASSAIQRITGSYPSEADIDRYIDAKQDLISEAPTVVYPQAA